MRLLLLTSLAILVRANSAAATTPDPAAARAKTAIWGPRVGFEDGPLMELLQRSMIKATGADVALASPLPRGSFLPARSLTSDDFSAALGRVAQQITTTTMTGGQIRALLERTASRFASYDFASSGPLLLPGEADSSIDSFEGLSYELDLTRSPGDRVVHLTYRGAPLDSAARLVVAVDDRRFSRGDLETAADPHRGIRLPEAWIDHLDTVVLDGRWEPNWSILPDYALTPQRPQIDRLVRHGGTPREDVLRLYPDEPARRGEMAYRLARAFGWRERRPSGAFPDVPDSLELWVDGLLRRDVLGTLSRAEYFQPFAPLTARLALEWCEAAARHARYALDAPQGEAFRRSLLAGLSSRAGSAHAGTDTLNHAEMLALIGNLRFPSVRVAHRGPHPGPAEATGSAEPDDALWFGGRDTVVVRGGVRLGLALRPAAGTDGSELTVKVGSTSTPVGPQAARESGPIIYELVVDPVALRTLEVAEYRGAGSSVQPSSRATDRD